MFWVNPVSIVPKIFVLTITTFPFLKSLSHTLLGFFHGKLHYKNTDQYHTGQIPIKIDKKAISYQFSYIIIIVHPSAFQNGMTLENRTKIEGARSKNVRSNVFSKFLAKT